MYCTLWTIYNGFAFYSIACSMLSLSLLLYTT